MVILVFTGCKNINFMWKMIIFHKKLKKGCENANHNIKMWFLSIKYVKSVENAETMWKW